MRRPRFMASARWVCTAVLALVALLIPLGLLRMLAWDDGAGGRIGCGSGSVWVCWFDLPTLATMQRGTPMPPTPRGITFVRPQSAPMVWWPRYNSLGTPPYYWGLEIPLWVLVALGAVPTGLLWWAEVRRRRRPLAGRCLSCGYDRSGLSKEDKCPECGTVPASASA
jgi:hypothetical protein